MFFRPGPDDTIEQALRTCDIKEGRVSSPNLHSNMNLFHIVLYIYVVHLYLVHIVFSFFCTLLMFSASFMPNLSRALLSYH